MIGQGSGHVVNTASMSGLVATASQASYAASKHAVVAISQTLRLEAKRHGVQVSVLCPGAVRTPAITGGRYGRADRYRKEGCDNIAERGRPITPEKFADRALRAVLRERRDHASAFRRGEILGVPRAAPPTLSMQFAKFVMLTPMRAIERSSYPGV